MGTVPAARLTAVRYKKGSAALVRQISTKCLSALCALSIVLEKRVTYLALGPCKTYCQREKQHDAVNNSSVAVSTGRI